VNAPGAYDDIDMAGLPDGLWRHVPADAQREVMRAFPELRLLWNPVIEQFQCVHKEPGKFELNYGLDGTQVMCNWTIIPGNYDPPLEVDRVVRQLRARAELAQRAAAEHGGIDALADKMAEEEIQRRKKAESDKFDDFFGINSETGYVAPIHNGSVVSRPYGSTNARFTSPASLPVAPAALDSRAFHARGPGRKELARRARRLDRSLREGVPL
jgi:hypothetical protein